VVGGPNNAQLASRQPPSDGAVGMPLRPGEWYPTQPPPPRETEEEKKKKPKHIATDRDDWGLPSRSHSGVAISRPIRVECYADRLVIVSDLNPANNKVIPFGPRTSAAIDPFISGVWTHMDAWGIAGRDMYWRPILRVSVAPDAQQRFAEFTALLEGSGLTVEKK
jgi:hypothetical protein